MKDRIKQIMEAVGLSQQDFAKELGISAASLSSIFTGRTNPTNNHVMAIHRVFPQINVNWLLFGEGDMIMKNQATNAPSLDKDLADETTTEEENLDASATNENNGNDTPSASIFGNLNTLVAPQPRSENVATNSQLSRRDNMQNTVRGNGSVVTTNMAVEREDRKIKEIRVFYSNGTYESFVPSNKM